MPVIFYIDILTGAARSRSVLLENIPDGLASALTDEAVY